MSAANMGKHIAPVIVVLDEISLREADAISDVLSGNGDSGNGEVAGLAQEPLDAILREDRFIERGRTKVVGPVHLKSALGRMVRGRKLRNYVGAPVVQERSKETPVNAVMLKILVHAYEILVAVAETGGIEYSTVQHRRVAGNVLHRRWSCLANEGASGIIFVYAAKIIIRCDGSGATGADVGRNVRIQDLRSKGARVVRLREGRELGRGKYLGLVAGGRRGAKRFDSEQKEKLVMRNDRTANHAGEVVAVEGAIGVIGTR